MIGFSEKLLVAVVAFLLRDYLIARFKEKKKGIPEPKKIVDHAGPVRNTDILMSTKVTSNVEEGQGLEPTCSPVLETLKKNIQGAVNNVHEQINVPRKQEFVFPVRPPEKPYRS